MCVVRVRISVALGDELFVGALFDDGAVFHHQDQVGISDRRQAVGEDKAGAFGASRRHCMLQQQLSGCNRPGAPPSAYRVFRLFMQLQGVPPAAAESTPK